MIHSVSPEYCFEVIERRKAILKQYYHFYIMGGIGSLFEFFSDAVLQKPNPPTSKSGLHSAFLD